MVESNRTGAVTMLHHGARPPIYEHLAGDDETIARVIDHVERNLASPTSVLLEIASDGVRVDVLHVAPGVGRPFRTFVTVGMSSKPMHVPPDQEAIRYAELVLLLPSHWPLPDSIGPEDPRGWPFRELVFLARMPHVHETYLSAGHVVTNGDPPVSYERDSRFCGAILVEPTRLPTAFQCADGPGDECTWFHAIVPLHASELALARHAGPHEVLRRLEQHGYDEVLNPKRLGVADGDRVNGRTGRPRGR